MSDFLTISQLASLWKLHPITIRRYIREGKLQAVKVGGRIRIAENEVAHMAKTLHPFPRKPQPSHIATRPPLKAFTESDPFWRLKGLAASKEI